MHQELCAAILAFIKSHLAVLPKSIERLEKSGLELSEALCILDDTHEKILAMPEPRGAIFNQKMGLALEKNKALKTLHDIKKVLDGEESAILPSGWSTADTTELKFCPVASVDAERSFSIYKHLFSDRRQSFTEENLEKLVVSNCFYARKQ